MQTDTFTPQAQDQSQDQSQIQAQSHPHSLIASDRVEGTPVRRTNGEKIGTIERLMIDKLSGNVAYAVLSFGGFPRHRAQKHLPIPWARLKYDRTLGAYHVEMTDEELKRAPSFAADKEFDWGDRSQRSRHPQFLSRAAVLGGVLTTRFTYRRLA